MKAINEYIVKISSRCNINCDYCYEYNLGDSSWKNLSKSISDHTVFKLSERIKEHSAQNNIKDLHISLHGGEPLLVGDKRLNDIVLNFKRALPNLNLEFTVQTNGTLLSEEIIDVLIEHDIFVGVSLDGPQHTNDLHRIDFKNRSTFKAAYNGIKLLQKRAPKLLSGILAVIDISANPIETFDFISSLNVPNIDFVLPHHNWNNPPKRSTQTDYANWYGVIWSAWISGRNTHVNIRFLENLVRVLCDSEAIFEQMTAAPISLVTVNTDGGIEGVDTLKSSGTGVQDLKMNIFDHSFEDVLSHPVFSARQSGQDYLSDTCKKCDEVSVCNGGYFTHRYSSENNFKNPSVYCSDLKEIISTVRASLKGANASI